MKDKPHIAPTNEEISKYDDSIAASLISQCRYIMKGTPTVTMMKVCYNLTSGCLSLFTVCGTKEGVTDLVNQFHKGLIEQINESFDGT